MSVTIINNFLSHCDHDSHFARHAIEPFEERGGIDEITIHQLATYSRRPEIYEPILTALQQPGREDWFAWAGPAEKPAEKQENYHNSSNGGGNAVPISVSIKIGTAAECAADQADQ